MERIKTDQIGYQLEETKKAVFPCVGHCAFVVMNISTNDIVYQGTTGDLIFHGPSGQKVSVGDFSTVTAPGAYCIFSDELEPSYPFQIGDGAYFPVLIDLFRMFYLQRCGMRLKKEYAREYAHACCHAAEAVVYGTNEKKEVNGGWHDAGDYGRYVVAGAGSASPEHPHHRPSAAKKKAMPGMLVGGPDSGLHDDKAAEMLKDVPPAKCYIDELESYSTNEITIYWNAPLIYLIACIQKEK